MFFLRMYSPTFSVLTATGCQESAGNFSQESVLSTNWQDAHVLNRDRVSEYLRTYFFAASCFLTGV